MNHHESASQSVDPRLEFAVEGEEEDPRGLEFGLLQGVANARHRRRITSEFLEHGEKPEYSARVVLLYSGRLLLHARENLSLEELLMLHDDLRNVPAAIECFARYKRASMQNEPEAIKRFWQEEFYGKSKEQADGLLEFITETVDGRGGRDYRFDPSPDDAFSEHEMGLARIVMQRLEVLVHRFVARELHGQTTPDKNGG